MKRIVPKYGLINVLILWISLSFMALFAETAVGTKIENTAYARYIDAGGYEYLIQSQTVVTTVSEGYRLDITKDVERTVYSPSDTVRYHIDLSNSGNIGVSFVTVIDTLSNNLSYISSQPTATVAGQVISWNLQNIHSGAIEGIDLQCLIAPDVVSGISIENQANYVTSDEVSGRSQPTAITIGSRSDLLIESNIDRATAFAGDTLTYTITVINIGNAPATNTLLYNNLPYQVDFVSSSGNGQFYQGIITWVIGTIPEGNSITETFRAVVKDAVNPGMLLSNSSTVTCTESISASTQVLTQIIERILQPDLSIRRTIIPTTHPGDTLNYRIVFGNIGNSAATELVLSDSLDDELVFLSASVNPQYNAISHKLTWTFDTIPDAQEDSVEVYVLVKKGTLDGTVLKSNARIVCSEDKSASVVSYTTVLAPQLTFLKSSDSIAVAAGDEILYTISYRNTGSGAATSTVIRDTLSPNLSYISSNGTSTYDPDKHVVIWDLNTLAASMSSNESVELRARAQVPLPNGSVITNAADIVCNEGFSETSSVNMTVAANPELYIRKSVQARAYRGDTLTYVLTFGNEGNSVAPLTSISDTLPAELGFITANGSYNYDEDHHCVSWNIGDLSLGTDSTLFIKAVVLNVPMSTHNISNTANIHSQSIHVKSNIAVTDLNAFDLSITASRDTIIGNGVSQTLIRVSAMDASGQAAPDGTPISLTSSLGTFISQDDTLYTLNGIVQNTLTSSVIDREYVPVNVKATLLDASGITDSVSVTFSALRIVGIVTNSDGSPVEGAIVTIILDDVIIGSDTTGADGLYSIAVYSSGKYVIRISYPDGNGDYDTIDKDLDVNVDDPHEFNTVDDKCSISGHLIDYNTQEPINIPDIPVIIQSDNASNLGKSTDGAVRDTTYTDSSGFWIFNDLNPGTYTIETLVDDDNVYHIGNASVVLGAAGQNMINFNIVQRPIIFNIYKTVDRKQALNSDTLSYNIVYGTTDNTVTDTIRIIDLLPSELEWIPSSLNYSGDIVSYEFDGIANQISFYLNGLSGNEIDSIQFKAKVKDGVLSMIQNEAVIMSRPDTAYSIDNTQSHSQTMIISPFLHMTKTVNWPNVEIGDILTYTLKLENRSESEDVNELIISDILPVGFRYRQNRSALNGHLISDPSISMQNKQQILTWTLSDTLDHGSTLNLKYRAIPGLDCRLGENENLASATAVMLNDYMVSSNTASAIVIVKPGMIRDRGLIFGKVYYDTNGNFMHDHNEETIKGVEIISEDGIRVLTDEYGKYSIPNVRMGDHILMVNQKTLPTNTHIVLSSSDFLGDVTTRLVKMTQSGIAKANFVIGNTNDQNTPEGKKHRVNSDKRVTDNKNKTQSVKMKKSESLVGPDGELLEFTLKEALFNVGSARLKPIAIPMLNKLGELLERYGDLTINVEGFTDNVGSNMLNKIISLNRAKTVKDYIINNYLISSERIVAIGHGKAFPIADNSSVAGRSLNRRVEITIKTTKLKKVNRKVMKMINAIKDEVEKNK